MTTTTKTKKSAKKQSPKKTALVNDAEIRVRIDAKTKSRAEKFFNRYGITTGDGIRMFIRQALERKTLPFDPGAPNIPNAETRKAIEDARAGKGLAPITTEGLKKLWDEL